MHKKSYEFLGKIRKIRLLLSPIQLLMDASNHDYYLKHWPPTEKRKLSCPRSAALFGTFGPEMPLYDK